MVEGLVNPAVRFQSSPEFLKRHFAIPVHRPVLLMWNALAIVVQVLPGGGLTHKKNYIPSLFIVDKNNSIILFMQ